MADMARAEARVVRAAMRLYRANKDPHSDIYGAESSLDKACAALERLAGEGREAMSHRSKTVPIPTKPRCPRCRSRCTEDRSEPYITLWHCAMCDYTWVPGGKRGR